MTRQVLKAATKPCASRRSRRSTARTCVETASPGDLRFRRATRIEDVLAHDLWTLRPASGYDDRKVSRADTQLTGSRASLNDVCGVSNFQFAELLSYSEVLLEVVVLSLQTCPT